MVWLQKCGGGELAGDRLRFKCLVARMLPPSRAEGALQIQSSSYTSDRVMERKERGLWVEKRRHS